MPKIRTSRSKERSNKRERRYFKNDLEQPYDEKGRKNPRFARIYGDEIYNKVDKYK